MKVLWITNQPTPKIAKNMNIKNGFGGGWMVDLSMQLSNIKDSKLAIAFPIEKSNVQVKYTLQEKIIGIGIPMEKNSLKIDYNVIEQYEKIINQFKPDIIHIWGTEYAHTYCAVKACENLECIDKTIVSIQGLVSVYAKHFWGYIDKRKECFSSLRDILKNNPLKKQQKDFEIRGNFEKEALKKVKYVIGRTDWDKACTQQINPNIKYFFCNETLRSSFYNKKWNIDKCIKHSIFVSQCQYPIKGLHLLLEAMPTILERYPNAHIFTTGRPKLNLDWKERLKLTSYEIYLKKIIERNNLSEHITFLGELDEIEMCNQYCKSNVFVSPSSIENSPNSVGEAMLLGVPVISSDVGGVKNMLNHNKDGYIYPADETYMIAHYICDIFNDDNKAIRFSENASLHASITHNRQKNLEILLDIYRTVIKNIV